MKPGTNSERYPARQAQTAAGRRHAVSQAATTLFARQGFHATSTAEVAKLAGVSEGIIFYHFGSKEGIFLDLLSQVLQDYTQRLDQVMDSAPDGLSAVLAQVEFHFQQVRRNSRILTLLVRDLPTGFGKRDSKCHRFMREQTGVILEKVASGLRRGQSDGSIAADLAVEETSLIIRGMLVGATRLLLLKLVPDVDYARQAVEFCRRALSATR